MNLTSIFNHFLIILFINLPIEGRIINGGHDYSVMCSNELMKVTFNLNKTQENLVIYLENLKEYPSCQPERSHDEIVFSLPLDENFYYCGTSKLHNKLTGTQIFYNRIVIEKQNKREKILVDCAFTKDLYNHLPNRIKRQNFFEELPVNFTELSEELLDYSGNVTQRAPIPYLNIGIRQNGELVDTSLNVSPGTPLEMVIYLDDKSSDLYALLTSFLKVNDNSPKNQEEIIILNGCSIDPYIFSNFESSKGGDILTAKFRAFKFPESNYVMFVGTVNVCLKECSHVSCGNDITGYGRRKRTVPYSIPYDPNKIYEVEMTSILRISSNPGNQFERKGKLNTNLNDGVVEGNNFLFFRENDTENRIQIIKTNLNSEYGINDLRDYNSGYKTSCDGSHFLYITSIIIYLLLTSLIQIH